MPWPWQANKPEPEVVPTGETPAAPVSPDATEARWRERQGMVQYYADYFIPLTEAMELLGKSEEYIRNSSINLIRRNGVTLADKDDVEHEQELIAQFPYPSDEEGHND